jgi:nucleoside-diphosphate-sugar epimerase
MSFWADKRVGVTGGAGFLGRSIEKQLIRRQLVHDSA